MSTPRICAECRGLTELYFKLAGEHSTLMERQRLMCEQEKADMEPLVLAAERRVEIARAEFIEHRKSHPEAMSATRG
jgi:hypothetical protein